MSRQRGGIPVPPQPSCGHALWALYVGLASFYQSVLTPWSSAVMLLLALGSVGAGVGLKVRSFVTLGAVSVGIVLGMNLLRFGLAFPQFWALYLTLAGISILGGMVGISMQKDRLRATLERLQSELEGWE